MSSSSGPSRKTTCDLSSTRRLPFGKVSRISVPLLLTATLFDSAGLSSAWHTVAANNPARIAIVDARSFMRRSSGLDTLIVPATSDRRKRRLANLPKRKKGEHLIRDVRPPLVRISRSGSAHLQPQQDGSQPKRRWKNRVSRQNRR